MDGGPVCLINPPSSFLLDQRVFVSLGILRVAAMLPQATFCDLNGVSDLEAALRPHAGAPAFGITATTPQLPSVVQIVHILRRIAPKARIVLGGPHVTLVNAAAKRGVQRAIRALEPLQALVDVLVAGDGEWAIFRALEPDPPPLIDADDPKSPWWVDRQDELPLPARHLADLETYRYEIDGVRATSMIAQLGCPFECAFCGGRFSPTLRRIRTRSTDSVVAEVEHLAQSWRGIMFYDDELNVNRQLVPMLRRIAPLNLRLRGFVKAELFTDEQAEAMAAAGFAWILVGFESGSPQILENIRKKATVADNTRCLEIARRHGLKVKALMSIGHAGESRETIQETAEWLAAVRPDDFDLTIISTYPGTPYFDEAVSDGWAWTYTARSGDRLHSYEVDYFTESEFYKGIPGRYRAFVWTDHLASAELVEIRDRAERALRAELDCTAPVRFEASMGCD